ncbi:hypothetical protein D9758_016422 [Tetrapyrgos nigripes]|uniref:Uncharacterized protein n=1 Tax=Tetrapyrgos nigripes TaxID=182062 RepID=A0A8H5CPK7_9AGAR|nr:hypothetical protein D9758_016422 [Tetrapyrgos nigripes]
MFILSFFELDAAWTNLVLPVLHSTVAPGISIAGGVALRYLSGFSSDSCMHSRREVYASEPYKREYLSRRPPSTLEIKSKPTSQDIEIMFLSHYFIFALPLAFASPLLPRQLQEGPNCTLNAMGKGVSIQLLDSKHPFLELGVPTAPQAGDFIRAHSAHGWTEPDFHLQQNGQANPNYIIKDVSNNNLAVAYLGWGANDYMLTFQQASDTGDDIKQLWDFSCGFCDPNAASLPNPTGAVLGGACQMHPHGLPDQCVQIIGVSDSSRYPVVSDCDVFNSWQFFNVVL